MEINSKLIFFLWPIFGNEIVDHVAWKRHCAITKKSVFEFKVISRFIMVYRTIIGVNFHLWRLMMSTSFLSLQTFRHNRSAVFGTMPPMCRGCPDVNKLRGMETTILGQHRPYMSIKSFVQHSGWQEMVSLCSLIRLIGVCADRDQPEFLCSRSDSRYLEVHVAIAGGWLTSYRPRKVRNSIYRYRKIHIDYRSKFIYRFISSISIIYGNTITSIGNPIVEIRRILFPQWDFLC